MNKLMLLTLFVSMFLVGCDKEPTAKPIISQYRRGLADEVVNALAAHEENVSVYDIQPLLNFQTNDFSEEAKSKLKQYFDETASEQSYDRLAHNVILLMGVADIQSAMGQLQAIVNQVEPPLHPFKLGDPQHKIAFAALKAMARMGDEKAIEECIRLVDSESDETFKMLVLLDHISYIRQPQAVEYFKEYLESNKEIGGGWDVVPTPYSRIGVEHLQEMIVGFPIKKDLFDSYFKTRNADLDFRNKWSSFDDYYIGHCRQWLEEQPLIEIIR